jgi:hypothetical protein
MLCQIAFRLVGIHHQGFLARPGKKIGRIQYDRRSTGVSRPDVYNNFSHKTPSCDSFVGFCRLDAPLFKAHCDRLPGKAREKFFILPINEMLPAAYGVSRQWTVEKKDF